MKPIKMIIGGVLVVCIALGIYALTKMRASSSGDDDDDTSAAENVTNIVTVQVAPLKRLTLHRYVDAYGTVEAAPATASEPAAGGTLAAPMAGVVSKVNVIAGQYVEKGDVLVELNSSTATFDSATTEAERQEKLYSQQNTSLKNVEDAKAQLASLQIIAPVSGTVTSVNVKPGQAVDSTTIVAEVIDLNRLAISANIPAAHADELQAGQEVQIQADPPVTAALSFVSPAIGADDGTVMVWAALPAGTKLRPGQFLPLKITTEVRTNCLAAPAESVVIDDTSNSTVALMNGNEADQTQVKTGLREDDWVEVDGSGLKEGDRVVTVGAYGLADKTQIQIATPAAENSTNSSEAQ
jgi:membrane fusion protein (multidrug efflux system)